MSGPKISIIAPCFNEQDVLPKLFERLGAVAAIWNLDYEVICVDVCRCLAANFSTRAQTSASLMFHKQCGAG
jgi:cellulose synthase/poly-beta-1,6-N-acetylglucosamine synthase-like glycosyltransferase